MNPWIESLPWLTALHVASDLTIGICCLAIPAYTIHTLRRAGKFVHPWPLTLFFAFTILCGLTYLVNVFTLWVPAYPLAGGLKFITALVCVAGLASVPAVVRRVLRSEVTAGELASAQLREQELLRSNQELKVFTQAASHDLQEPLRMVTSYLELISRDYGDLLDARGREFVEYTRDAGERMQHLLRRLLEYSTVEGGTVPRKQECDLGRLLDLLKTDLAIALESAEAHLVHEDMPTLSADPLLLKQVLQNLLLNAVKFRAHRPLEIQVKAERRNGFWQISVMDNGVGIPEDALDLIFRPFERAHDPAEFGGSGLGLAICRKIVESHGGTMGVESVRGEGSTFYFTLPQE